AAPGINTWTKVPYQGSIFDRLPNLFSDFQEQFLRARLPTDVDGTAAVRRGRAQNGHTIVYADSPGQVDEFVADHPQRIFKVSDVVAHFNNAVQGTPLARYALTDVAAAPAGQNIEFYFWWKRPPYIKASQVFARPFANALFI